MQQVSYTFSRDFISLLLKDKRASDFGRTEILIKALRRVGEMFCFYFLENLILLNLLIILIILLIVLFIIELNYNLLIILKPIYILAKVCFQKFSAF